MSEERRCISCDGVLPPDRVEQCRACSRATLFEINPELAVEIYDKPAEQPNEKQDNIRQIRMEDIREMRARTINEIVQGKIDPFLVDTWPPEQQRNHRLRRAIHELMADPRYRIEIGEKPDGTIGVRIVSEHNAKTPEAQAFLVKYREEFITHLTWLEAIDEEHGVSTDETPLSARKAA